MTTSPSPVVLSRSSSNGACGSSLPPWRLFLQMLNWRRDPDHERKLALIEIRIQDSERRTRQIENDIEQIENDIEQIKRESDQIESEIDQIEREADLIESENEQLRELNARGRLLLSRIDALCFPDGISSTPAPPTAIDSRPSSP